MARKTHSGKVYSLYVPLVFSTSIDPPAFRPCTCMNWIEAALKQPAIDIMSPQAFIELPFILLMPLTLNSLTAYSVSGTPKPCKWRGVFGLSLSLWLIRKCHSSQQNVFNKFMLTKNMDSYGLEWKVTTQH